VWYPIGRPVEIAICLSLICILLIIIIVSRRITGEERGSNELTLFTYTK